MRTLLMTLALLALPALALAQTAPDRKLGGCTDDGTLCAGPAATVSVVALDLTHDTTRSGLIPGLGYGVTAWADKPWNIGAALYLSYVRGEDADTFAPAVLVSVAEYLRVGIGWEHVTEGGGTSTLLLFGLGVDFGPTPGLGLVGAAP